jgi:hypothetical protein
VYWEFDPDNAWANAFFLCHRYEPASTGNEDWASDFTRRMEGPSLPSFAGLYDPTFNGSESAAATNLYLFARTFRTFGESVKPIWPQDKPLAAAFHDQDPVIRVVPASGELGT